MGLLDDLKQQADAVLVNQRAHQEQLNDKLKRADICLQKALRYWIELFNSLNIIKPPIRRNYFVEGSSQLENLLQCDYNVNGRRQTVDHHDYVDAVVLRFRCVGSESLVIEKESAGLVDRLRQHLWSHALKFDVREIKRGGAYVERGVFAIVPEVTVTITLAAEVDRSELHLTLRNLERLVEYSYVYDYDELGAELLDEIGKAILGKPHRLRAIGRRQARSVAARPPAGVERRVAI